MLEVFLMKVATVPENKVFHEVGHIEDIQLASTKMTGAARRAFQAEMLGEQWTSSDGVGRPYNLVCMRNVAELFIWVTTSSAVARSCGKRNTRR